MRQIGMRWPDDLIAQVDQARGSTSRSEFIRSCVTRCLKGVSSSQMASVIINALPPCEHPKPWNQLDYGTFCNICGKKMR